MNSKIIILELPQLFRIRLGQIEINMSVQSVAIKSASKITQPFVQYSMYTGAKGLILVQRGGGVPNKD